MLNNFCVDVTSVLNLSSRAPAPPTDTSVSWREGLQLQELHGLCGPVCGSMMMAIVGRCVKWLWFGVAGKRANKAVCV